MNAKNLWILTEERPKKRGLKNNFRIFCERSSMRIFRRYIENYSYTERKTRVRFYL